MKLPPKIDDKGTFAVGNLAHNATTGQWRAELRVTTEGAPPMFGEPRATKEEASADLERFHKLMTLIGAVEVGSTSGQPN